MVMMMLLTRVSSSPAVSRKAVAAPLVLALGCLLFLASPNAATASSDLWCGDSNCYEVLGLLANATGGEIKKAYFKQSLKWHPDKNPSEEAKDKFAKLAGAYEILSEPRRREVRLVPSCFYSFVFICVCFFAFERVRQIAEPWIGGEK